MNTVFPLDQGSFNFQGKHVVPAVRRTHTGAGFAGGRVVAVLGAVVDVVSDDAPGVSEGEDSAISDTIAASTADRTTRRIL
ncbi:MAG TPA: hypothetical protein PLG60_09475 [Acidimicrobiales bacterium]|nr:hypothetical protein [Acidimicrobiales bacterium]